jgi:hypothetical protein
MTLGQLREATKGYPDELEVEFVLLNGSNCEIKLDLKSAYKHIDFDNENYEVNNKIIFVTKLKKEGK